MSGFEYDDDQGEELVPDEDWPTFFTMVPVWLLLCGCSAQAYRMYAFLAEHINQRTPGQRIACPKQVAIARVLGLKDDRQVARYRQELAELGALRVEEYRYNGGMRRGYRYVVRFNPPAGFEGLRSLQAFYEANPDVRSARSEGRTATAKAPVPAQAGPAAAETAPPDHAAAAAAPKPARPKPAGVRSNEIALPDAVLQVLAAFPQELRNAMKETAHTDRPKTLVTAVTKALSTRTVDELVDRVSRRWVQHGYATKFEAGELARPVGAAVAMLRTGDCPDPGCEDGRVLATGAGCVLCAERTKDHKAARSRVRQAERQADRLQAVCPACERERGTGGEVCDPCAEDIEQQIVKAADQAAIDGTFVTGEHRAAQLEVAREVALGLARQAREAAARDGASRFGQLLAARMAVQAAARQAHDARMARVAAPHDGPAADDPAQASAPSGSAWEVVPCRGTQRDGTDCHRTAFVEDDGLCGPCRGVRQLQADGLAAAR
ncbi:hypothetical protein [Kitasatospora sp. HPMI-4]|uniref:hypothetical protein n=1 Tax=Kitasatospora sp. HPMI-4 TaxID=3448443 RepID=UPI003F1CBBB4